MKVKFRLQKYYRTVREVKGPLLIVEKVKEVGYGEVVKVLDPSGRERMGTVIDVAEDFAVVQVLEGTSELDVDHTTVSFYGDTYKIPMSDDVLGRVLDGLGRPNDEGPPIEPLDYMDVNGLPINPVSRDYPKEFIETGISAIDGMNTISRGQKIALFTGSGLPHNLLTSQIARQARAGDEEDFAVVLATMGVTSDEARFFREELEGRGALHRSVLIINLADDPPIERLMTPRVALTIAEYLAFELGIHVLVLLTDMLNYAGALREISAARGEVPSRRGYPGYLYTDLATLYERCGRIKGLKGSITLIPVVTMPNDDVTYPVVDLTGYITEGQIYLDRGLHQKGIYPPINVLPSLSRLMKEAAKYTRRDHMYLSNQLYAAYAEAQYIRSLSLVVGEEALTPRDRKYLSFGEAFERKFVNQGPYERRSLDETLELGWELLAEYLPEEELTRIPPEILEEYYPKRKRE
ncbi:MAG: V-type ATP synthase subunit B [Thermofilum sp. ex4484_15]|nr:MAG: V-type ATP synthase subunit B [Thermofilum sp. ex4484_15]